MAVFQVATRKPALRGSCACGHSASRGGQRTPTLEQPRTLQAKLRVGAVDDPLEREAGRIAAAVMGSSASPAVATNAPGAGLQRKCKACESEDAELRRKPLAGSEPGSPTVDLAARIGERRGHGSPLPAASRAFFEPRFQHDFSRVRVHTDTAAEAMAESLNAEAFTIGGDIFFGPARFAPQAIAGQRLLAHELTHVVQQQSRSTQLPLVVQRQTLEGGPGKVASDKARPLTAVAGPMLDTSHPGGTPVAGTADPGQNCAGDSCSISKWVNWPHLGYEFKDLQLPAGVQGDWSQAISFVPSGCTRVNCTGIDVNHTRCKKTELELIALLYRWPVTKMVEVPITEKVEGKAPVTKKVEGKEPVTKKVEGKEPVTKKTEVKALTGTQSDFHMMGRSAADLPSGWHSKMDRREKVVDIRDPLQSLHDAYPHTLKPDREIKQLCFCCQQKDIKAT